MSNFDIQKFKSSLYDADIVAPVDEIKGSVTYLDHGLRIRELLYSQGINLLRADGFKEVKLTDLIDESDLKVLDDISPITQNYMKIAGSTTSIAASHETSFYLFVRNELKKMTTHFPLKFYSFGAVYRYPKNSKFPFSLGERRSFLECYSITQTKETADAEFAKAVVWNRTFIQDLLGLPSVEVVRPHLTNKPFSSKTVCIDTLTPIGITAITGMTYAHDDIFTKKYRVKYKDWKINKNKFAFTTHFGVSDNLLFSYLLNCFDDSGFNLLSIISPVQVSVLTDSSTPPENVHNIFKYTQVRYELKSLATTKDFADAHTENNMRGVPLTIRLQGETATIHTRTTKKIQATSALSLQVIQELLNSEDSAIKELFKARESESIVYCKTIAEISDAIQAGKTAYFPLESSDDTLVKLEQKLLSGEVLGFNITADTERDVLTGLQTTSLAFASRRS